MAKYILALCLLWASAVHAQQRYTANFSRTDESSQFHIFTSAMATPELRFALSQGTTPYAPTNGTGVYLRYGRSDSDPLMATLYGTLVGSTAVIQAVSNDFPVPVDGWYAGLVLTSSVSIVSVRGQITVRRSPEISAPGVLSKTYAVNGSEYGPFTGSFDNWPFITAGNIGGAITTALNNANVSTSDLYQVMAGTGISVSQGSGPVAIVSVGPSVVTTSALASTLAGYATGTPVYTTSGLATGTPLYAYTESDPVALAALDNYLTTTGAAATYATIAVMNASNAAQDAAIAAVNSLVTTGYLKLAGGGNVIGNLSASGGVNRIYSYAQSLAGQVAGSGMRTISIDDGSPTNRLSGAFEIVNSLTFGSSPQSWTNKIVSYVDDWYFVMGGGSFVNISTGRLSRLYAGGLNSTGTVSAAAFVGPVVGSGTGITDIVFVPSVPFNMNAQPITNVSYIGSPTSHGIHWDVRQIYGTGWSFDNQPTIPGYVTTNGNASGLTNFPATLATSANLNAASNAINTAVTALTARVTLTEGYTNRAASALSSSVWASADSTTNYQTRTGFNSYTTAQAVVNTAFSTGKVDVASLSTSITATVNATAITNVSGSIFTNVGTIQFGTNTPVAIGTRTNAISIGQGAASRSQAIQFWFTGSTSGVPENATLFTDNNGNLRINKYGSGGGVGGHQIYDSQSFNANLYPTVAAANTNYWRTTATQPTNSNDSGVFGQITITPRDATSVWFNAFYAPSNKWYRMPLSEFP